MLLLLDSLLQEIKMGSTFSVTNDTDQDIWVWVWVWKAVPQPDRTTGLWKKNCTRYLEPGQTYYSGKLTLSLSKSVWLMNSNGDYKHRTCWTGATDNSNISYSARNDFA